MKALGVIVVVLTTLCWVCFAVLLGAELTAGLVFGAVWLIFLWVNKKLVCWTTKNTWFRTMLWVLAAFLLVFLLPASVPLLPTLPGVDPLLAAVKTLAVQAVLCTVIKMAVRIVS